MRTRSYRDLTVWRKAMLLALESYRVARMLPAHELYGLGRQVRRAAASVAANIAEGYGRLHRGDYLRYLSIARGSLMELETHIELIRMLEYVGAEELTTITKHSDETSRLLTAVIRGLRC
ncbi:MAG: four helix bundle protein [Gemmatimonadota bacterium]|nr:four helix bundle protein [Gemmatimonadota bacterium]